MTAGHGDQTRRGEKGGTEVTGPSAFGFSRGCKQLSLVSWEEDGEALAGEAGSQRELAGVPIALEARQQPRCLARSLPGCCSTG